MLRALLAALALTACAEYPDPYPRGITLDASFADAHGGEIQQALDTWDARFPGCPHVVVDVRDLSRESYTAGDLAFGPALPERPETTGRYSNWGRWLEITELAVDQNSVTNTILHELGHGHGIHGHMASGMMSPNGGGPENVTIDDAMARAVCGAHSECCD